MSTHFKHFMFFQIKQQTTRSARNQTKGVKTTDELINADLILPSLSPEAASQEMHDRFSFSENLSFLSCPPVSTTGGAI